MKKLYIIVPSRGGRPSLNETIESWYRTSSGNSELIVAIDKDEKDKYTDLVTHPILGVNIAVLPKRYYLAPKLNTLASSIIGKDFGINPLGIGYVADDCVFRTEGWEDRVITKLATDEGIVYCNDLLQGDFLPNNVFIHADIVKTLGFMCPLTLNHYYIDNYWKDLGLRANIIHYFPEIVIEHMHWETGKATKDEIHTEMEGMLPKDNIAYDQYVLRGYLQRDVDKILKNRTP